MIKYSCYAIVALFIFIGGVQYGKYTQRQPLYVAACNNSNGYAYIQHGKPDFTWEIIKVDCKGK